MTLSIYDASVPLFTRGLGGLSHVLDKAAAFAEARNIDPAVLLALRLYPDMYPLTRQVQSATDHAKGAGARLAGVEVPKFPDVETTFPELKARLDKTIAFIGGLDRQAFEGAEDRDVVLGTGASQRVLKGRVYLFTSSLPNFYFHVTTAYAILRQVGLEIGKRDFLGS
ncbi:MAG: DUF1993 family protein [Hyphomicrobium sp.]